MRATVLLVLMAVGCGSARNPTTVEVFPLINSSLPRGELGQPDWGFSRIYEADLDRDGRDERIILLADVAIRNGEPLWDDSQIWQVYVEEPDGERTYLFSRSVQLGKLEIRLVHDPAQPRILLFEDTPTVFAVYEITYKSPQDFTTVALAQRHLNPGAFRNR